MKTIIFILFFHFMILNGFIKSFFKNHHQHPIISTNFDNAVKFRQTDQLVEKDPVVNPLLNEPINIRMAKFSDLSCIVNLRVAVFYPLLRTDTTFHKKLLEKLRKRFDRGTVVLVAMKNGGSFIAKAGSMFFGNLLGSVEVNEFDFENSPLANTDNDKKLYVADLAVREDARRIGLATFLLKSVEDYAKFHKFQEIVLHVEIDNEVAQKLYEKNGYSAYPLDEDAIKFTEKHLMRPASDYVMLHKRMI